MNEVVAKLPIDEMVDYLKSGDAAKAEAASRRVLAGSPDDCDALMVLAISLGMSQRHEEATRIYRQLIQVQPAEPSHYNNLGTALWDMGELAKAEQAYRKALSLKPDDVAAMSSLGALRWHLGDAVETRDLMLATWRLDPGLPEPRIYGALACYECGDTEMVERLLEGSESWQFLGAKLEADLATTLLQIDRTVEAERRLRTLLEYPEFEGIARIRLAGLLERVNRLDEAEEMLARVATTPSMEKEEQLARATLAARRGRYAEAIPLYRSSLQPDATGISNVSIWFALAKSCDAIDDTAAAIDALGKAHAEQMIHATRLLPNLASDDSQPLTILNYPVLEKDYQRWIPDTTAPSAEESPIFIVGFPRSGTTLLEQMLDAHPGLKSMDERSFLQKVIHNVQDSGKLTYPDDLDQLDSKALEALRNTYWDCVKGVVRLAPGERLVDKNPLNIMRLPIIHRIFPNAKIILALRHPCDVLLSNYMQCFRAPIFQVMCSTLARLARGYAESMDFWVRHAALFNPAVMELRYEDLVDDVDSQIERIANHLGLSDANALRGFRESARAKGFISTPSYSQVIEPLSRKAIGRWHRYREHLEPDLPLLKPAMDRWGYEA